LRIGGDDRSSCEGQRDRKGKRDFCASNFISSVAGVRPTFDARFETGASYPPGAFGPRPPLQDCAPARR